MWIFTQHRQIHSPKLKITTIFYPINVSLFRYKISLKCSSTNVLVFVFKFFSYNQTDNPLLSSTVKYITRINIMLQQRPRSPPYIPSHPDKILLPPACSPSPSPNRFSPSMPPSPPVNSQIHKQTHRGVWKCRWLSRATLWNHMVTLSGERRKEKRKKREKEIVKQTANVWSR